MPRGFALSCLLALLVMHGTPAFGQELIADQLRVHSWEGADLLGAEIESRLDHPFAQVRETLTEAEAWCEFIPLVFNVKACTFERREEGTWLTFHIGRKFHHSAAQAIRLRYRFRVQENSPTSVRIHLFAAEGPHGTGDYLIELQARPTADGQTALVFHSSFRPSWRSRLATRVYLSGAGRDKVGFSIEGYQNGEPVYARGVKGVVERNAMRYFLALKAYLDTLHLPEEERFEARLQAWFAATERYPRQLREMEKEEYLEGKRREWQNQQERQRRIAPTE